jgi:two-component system response regulator MprA
MEASLLIIEDEIEYADYLRRGLTYAGYRLRIVSSAEEGLEQLRRNQPELILLDVMLPGMDGMTACRRLRESGFVGPVLMLTARDAVPDRVLGLDSGADDYLAKPFAFDELLARLRALLRRTGGVGNRLTFANLELDSGLRTVRRNGAVIQLTRTEYELLTLLLEHPRQALSRETLMACIWDAGNEHDPNLLDVYVSRLRRKLGNPPLIHTRHGVGYSLQDSVA